MTERILVKDLVPKIEDHAQRIKVLEKTKGEFDDHIQKHDDVYVPMLKKHDRTLYGEHGDDGMVFGIKEVANAIKDINKKLDEKADNNKWLYRLVVGTFLTSIITAFLTLILK